MSRFSLLAALGLVLALPDTAAAQRRPDHDRDDRRAGWNRGDDGDERRVRRVRRTAPDFGGVSLGLYGGGVDGMPTGGVRLGVGLVRLYAEGSNDGYDEGLDRYGDEPTQTAFGIDLTMPARHPGLRALYGVAGVGVQTREAPDVYYAYEGDAYGCDIRLADPCPTNGYGRDETRFYGTLGLGVRLPVWRGRVALTGEVAGRFVAARQGYGAQDGYVAPVANVGVAVRLR